MSDSSTPTAVVTSKGQLVVPVRIRRKFGIKKGTHVLFIERGAEIVLQPVTKEFIRGLQGSLRAEGTATTDLLRERAADRIREERRR